MVYVFVFVALFSSRGQETIFLTHRYFLVKARQKGKIDRLGTCLQLFSTDVPTSQHSGEIISVGRGAEVRLLAEREREEKKMFPGLLFGPGNDRGTDRNRRASSSLSPIFYLFLMPSEVLYQKVQHRRGFG